MSGYFRYTYNKGIYATELLWKTLRLGFIKGRLLFSALRDHPYMKASMVIAEGIYDESVRRMTTPSLMFHIPRRQYMGIKDVPPNFAVEIFDWVVNSNFNRIDNYEKLMNDE